MLATCKHSQDYSSSRPKNISEIFKEAFKLPTLAEIINQQNTFQIPVACQKLLGIRGLQVNSPSYGWRLPWTATKRI